MLHAAPTPRLRSLTSEQPLEFMVSWWKDATPLGPRIRSPRCPPEVLVPAASSLRHHPFMVWPLHTMPHLCPYDAGTASGKGPLCPADEGTEQEGEERLWRVQGNHMARLDPAVGSPGTLCPLPWRKRGPGLLVQYLWKVATDHRTCHWAHLNQL